MAKRRGKRGSTKSVSLLTTLFAVTPALFVLTNTPSGMSSSALGYLLTSSGWQGLQNAGVALVAAVIQNWVTILILLAVIFVAIKVTHKLGRGARITKHLRL